MNQTQTRKVSNGEAQLWCMKHGIIITFESIDNHSGFIRIDNNGRVKDGFMRYKIHKLKHKDPKWWDKIMELYHHYYNHYQPRQKSSVACEVGGEPEVFKPGETYEMILAEIEYKNLDMYNKILEINKNQ